MIRSTPTSQMRSLTSKPKASNRPATHTKPPTNLVIAYRLQCPYAAWRGQIGIVPVQEPVLHWLRKASKTCSTHFTPQAPSHCPLTWVGEKSVYKVPRSQENFSLPEL